MRAQQPLGKLKNQLSRPIVGIDAMSAATSAQVSPAAIRCSASRRWRGRSIPPEILEAARRRLGVAHRVLDVAVPEVRLQRAGIDAVIGQLEAAGVAQHVRMHFDAQSRCNAKPRHHLRKPAGVNGAPRSDVKINGEVAVLVALEPA